MTVANIQTSQSNYCNCWTSSEVGLIVQIGPIQVILPTKFVKSDQGSVVGLL